MTIEHRSIHARTKLPTIRALSLGAGVQSSALHLMSAHGLLPRIDYAAFADTGWQRPETYAALDRLENEVAKPAGIEIVRLHAGDIRRDALSQPGLQALLPDVVEPERPSRGDDEKIPDLTTPGPHRLAA